MKLGQSDIFGGPCKARPSRRSLIAYISCLIIQIPVSPCMPFCAWTYTRERSHTFAMAAVQVHICWDEALCLYRRWQSGLIRLFLFKQEKLYWSRLSAPVQLYIWQTRHLVNLSLWKGILSKQGSKDSVTMKCLYWMNNKYLAVKNKL